MADPVDDIGGLGNGDDVSKPDTRAYLKARTVGVFANANEVRSYDLSGRTSILAGISFYRKDTESVATDDGDSVVIDDGGNHWLKFGGGAGESGGLPSLADFGASPAASAAVNDAAISAAEASGHGVFFVPEGVYQTNFTPYQVINKRYVGPGKIEMGGYAQAPMRSFITSQQPVSSTSRLEMFDALGAKQHRASYSFIGSGANPSTLPTTYTNFVEWSADVHVHDYSAGFNVDVADHALGRSGAFVRYSGAYHGGQGDLVFDSYYGEMYSSRPGATHFIANPALAFQNGGIGATAASHGGYMQGHEFIFKDHAAAGMACIYGVRNYHRQNTSTDLDQVWIDQRVQVANEPIDCVLSMAGPMVRGIDGTAADYGAGQGFIIGKAGQRIYLAGTAVPDSIGIKFFATDFGDEWIQAVGNTINFGSRDFAAFNVQSVVSAVNSITAVGQVTANAPQIVVAGPDTNIGLQVALKGTGQAHFTNASGFMFVPSGNDTLAAVALAQTLTNKTISGSANTLTNIPAANLAGTALPSGIVNSSLATAATSFTAGSLVTAVDHVTVNGYVNASGALVTSQNRGLTMFNQTSGAGAAAGTLSNAPIAGNPAFWARVSINSTNYVIPCWAG